MRLIDADELKKALNELYDNTPEYELCPEDVDKVIDNAPTVVEHIVVDKINGDTGKITYHSADMRGEKADENS